MEYSQKVVYVIQTSGVYGPRLATGGVLGRSPSNGRNVRAV